LRHAAPRRAACTRTVYTARRGAYSATTLRLAELLVHQAEPTCAQEAGCKRELTSCAAPGADALPAGDVPPSEGDAASARPALLAPLAAGLAPPPPASHFGAGYDFAGELAHVRRRAAAPRPSRTPASSSLLSSSCACCAPCRVRRSERGARPRPCAHSARARCRALSLCCIAGPQ